MQSILSCIQSRSLRGNRLLRLLKIQKRCARAILDANISQEYGSSVGLFNRLGWIPIPDVIELRKMCIVHNIFHGKCPDYLIHYIRIRYVNTRHHYTTRRQVIWTKGSIRKIARKSPYAGFFFFLKLSPVWDLWATHVKNVKNNWGDHRLRCEDKMLQL